MNYESAEDVEKRFNVTFTNDQFVLITNYLLYGVIPDPDGCMGCDAQYIRQLIGTIQAEEQQESKQRKK